LRVKEKKKKHYSTLLKKGKKRGDPLEKTGEKRNVLEEGGTLELMRKRNRTAAFIKGERGRDRRRILQVGTA